MRPKREQIFIVAAVIVFLAVGMLLIRQAPESYRPYVSMSPSPDGVKGLYVLLEESDVRTGRWQQAWRFLPDTSNQTMIVIEPQYIAWQEKEQLLEWVRKGNDVLWFEQIPAEWETELVDSAVQDEFPFTFNDSENVPAPAVVIYDADGYAYRGSVSSPVRIGESEFEETLLRDEHGVIAARQEVGSGSLSLFLTPEWTQNETIVEQDHFELLWPYLLGSSREVVWFDEYQHGYREAPALIAIYPEWMIAVGAQLLIVALLWLFAGAVRFGPIHTPREWVVRRGDETLQATAAWYERNGLTREAFRLQQRFIRSLMQQRWGVQSNASGPQLINAARSRWDRSGIEQLTRLIGRWDQFEREPEYTPKQYVDDSRLADEIIRKLMRK